LNIERLIFEVSVSTAVNETYWCKPAVAYWHNLRVKFSRIPTWNHRHTRQTATPPPTKFWKIIEIRGNARRNQENLGRFIGKYWADLSG
jgi:hypothetical protein